VYRRAFAAYARHIPWDESAEWYGDDPQIAWDDCPRGAWLAWASAYGPCSVAHHDMLRVVRACLRKTQPFASGLPVYYRALNAMVDALDHPDDYLAIQRDELVSIHPEEVMVPKTRHTAWQWEQAVLDAVEVALGDHHHAYSAVWHAEQVLPNGLNLGVVVWQHLPEQRFTKES